MTPPLYDSDIYTPNTLADLGNLSRAMAVEKRGREESFPFLKVSRPRIVDD